MIKLKDLKENFHLVNCINLNKRYNLYSNTEKGARTNKLYLGYISVDKGVVTHYPTNETFKDLNVFTEFVNNWAQTSEFESSTYNPDTTMGAVAEMRLYDWFTNNGFEADYREYIYNYSNLDKSHSFRINVDVDWNNGTEYYVTAYVDFGSNGIIDISSDNYKEVIDSVKSIAKVTMLDNICNAFNLYSKFETTNMDKLNDMILSKPNGFSLVNKSFKDYLIETLENVLTEIKK